MLHTIHCRRPAMATLFEAWLVGDDEEHLTAVGEAVLDEIERVEQVLSRFDRTAELYRVNRQAARQPTRLSHELYAVIKDCVRWHTETEGFFDPTAGVHSIDEELPPLPFSAAVQLDAERRTVTFTDPRVRLDLGGYGKGYALDAAARILDRYQINSGLLHGGTSSLLARGTRADGEPWLVAVGDPFHSEQTEIAKFPLRNEGMSTSAAWDARHAESDIIDPTVGRPITASEAFCVTAPTATEAEVLSTALTAMGTLRAGTYLDRRTTSGTTRFTVRCLSKVTA